MFDMKACVTERTLLSVFWFDEVLFSRIIQVGNFLFLKAGFYCTEHCWVPQRDASMKKNMRQTWTKNMQIWDDTSCFVTQRHYTLTFPLNMGIGSFLWQQEHHKWILLHEHWAHCIHGGHKGGQFPLLDFPLVQRKQSFLVQRLISSFGTYESVSSEPKKERI